MQCCIKYNAAKWTSLLRYFSRHHKGRSLRGNAQAGLSGEQLNLRQSKTSDNNPTVKRTSVGGGSGPLIPRASGFNGGIVFDCPRSARDRVRFMSLWRDDDFLFSLKTCALAEPIRIFTDEMNHNSLKIYSAKWTPLLRCFSRHHKGRSLRGNA